MQRRIDLMAEETDELGSRLSSLKSRFSLAHEQEADRTYFEVLLDEILAIQHELVCRSQERLIR